MLLALLLFDLCAKFIKFYANNLKSRTHTAFCFISYFRIDNFSTSDMLLPITLQLFLYSYINTCKVEMNMTALCVWINGNESQKSLDYIITAALQKQNKKKTKQNGFGTME